MVCYGHQSVWCSTHQCTCAVCPSKEAWNKRNHPASHKSDARDLLSKSHRRRMLDEHCAVSARGCMGCWVHTHCPWNPRPIHYSEILHDINTGVFYFYFPQVRWAKLEYQISIWVWHPIGRDYRTYLYVWWDQGGWDIGLVSLDQCHHWSMPRTLKSQPTCLQQFGWCPTCMWRFVSQAHPPWNRG